MFTVLTFMAVAVVLVSFYYYALSPSSTENRGNVVAAYIGFTIGAGLAGLLIAFIVGNCQTRHDQARQVSLAPDTTNVAAIGALSFNGNEIYVKQRDSRSGNPGWVSWTPPHNSRVRIINEAPNVPASMTIRSQHRDRSRLFSWTAAPSNDSNVTYEIHLPTSLDKFELQIN